MAYTSIWVVPRLQLTAKYREVMNHNERLARVSAMGTDERHLHLKLLQGEIYIRASAVQQQVHRIRERSQANAEYIADLWLLSEAVRATIRAGELCLLLIEGDEQIDIKQAVERVNALVPNALEIRDAVEHFDDYLLGVGKRQTLGNVYTLTYEKSRDNLIVHVGPWSLDMNKAEAAANHLASVVITGKDHLVGLVDVLLPHQPENRR